MNKILVFKLVNSDFFFYESHSEVDLFIYFLYETFYIFGRKVIVKAIRDTICMIITIETFHTEFDSTTITYFMQYHNFNKFLKFSLDNLFFDNKCN